MDFSGATKVIYDKIYKLEPENVSKIIGFLLLQEHGERELIRLAFSPESQIHLLINKAKTELGLFTKPEASPSSSPTQFNPSPILDLPFQFNPYLPASPRPFTSSALWDLQITADHQPVRNVEYLPVRYPDSASNEYHIQNQIQLLSLQDGMHSVNHVQTGFSSNCYFTDSAVGPRSNRRSPRLPEVPVKVCHYFNKGFCKHGSNCRYFHGHMEPESFSRNVNLISHETGNEDQGLPPGSLEELKMELTELLKSRRGYPVSIASLPMLYYERYGKTLQADGYLTESQRHGKTGYSLTKLLARLKNCICVIDRPHGQHSVILAEDVPKYMEFIGDKNEHGGFIADSRQIYLTFPAESTFTEQDVSNYFSNFGPVQDVRIPCQQKRMFGFVTFIFAETVKQILAKGNPHFVCGARVLVKPYREKLRPFVRKFSQKIQHDMSYDLQFIDAECEFQPIHRTFDDSRMRRKNLIEENEHAVELERLRLYGMNLVAGHVNYQKYNGYSIDELKLLEACAEKPEFTSAVHSNYVLNVLNTTSDTTEEMVGAIKTKPSHQESQGLNLPDSPLHLK
ncbi:zinc finger CCCH domain-containing protein 18-like [Heracleum sosnowskyi]|uniref:Zinc finger CCCH domain-containing protein 18-like n=1 Tax=Heracleum sosnowskyi TaxID=360622 RepID=A0AAD8IQJ6_9APIA|nr:zinc finger CCCH domain-containing protein 18-like [Heracleum sosnowskyi]